MANGAYPYDDSTNLEQWRARFAAAIRAYGDARASEEFCKHYAEALEHDRDRTAALAALAAEKERARGEEERHAALQARCFEGFPSVSDGIFDALKEADAEVARLREVLGRIEDLATFNTLGKLGSLMEITRLCHEALARVAGEEK